MKGRPVIILGGGLWGCLLAYRLGQQKPHVEYRLYEDSPTLGLNQSWCIKEDEFTEDSLEWIKPFISQKWKTHQMMTDKVNKYFSSKLSLIMPGKLEKIIRASIPSERIISNAEESIESLLEKGSFIIDARQNPFHKGSCSRKSLGILVSLEEKHGFYKPLSVDLRVEQKELLRYMQYLPIDEYTLLVKDVRFSKNSVFDYKEIEVDLLTAIHTRWKIKEILHRENEVLQLPRSHMKPWNEGRVIKLSGIVNQVTGDDFVDAVKLIDQITNASFRFGEIKSVVQRYRDEKKQRSFFSRALTRMLYHAPHAANRIQILEYLFKMPDPVLAKFLAGDIGFFDVSRAFIGNPPLPLVRAALRY